MGKHLQREKGNFGMLKDKVRPSPLDLKGRKSSGKMKSTKMGKAVCRLQQVDDRESEFHCFYREYRRSAGYPRAKVH